MKIAQKFIEMLKVHPNKPKQLLVNLSGGNQQKVIIAKWLQSDSKILILDEPTRGIDVGAKFEIYALLREVARQGKAIIFISSELAEILEVPHRYLAFKDGKIAGKFKNGQINDEHELLSILSA